MDSDACRLADEWFAADREAQLVEQQVRLLTELARELRRAADELRERARAAIGATS